MAKWLILRLQRKLPAAMSRKHRLWGECCDADSVLSVGSQNTNRQVAAGCSLTLSTKHLVLMLTSILGYCILPGASNAHCNAVLLCSCKGSRADCIAVVTHYFMHVCSCTQQNYDQAGIWCYRAWHILGMPSLMSLPCIECPYTQARGAHLWSCMRTRFLKPALVHLPLVCSLTGCFACKSASKFYLQPCLRR